jgi:peroxiredoxin
MAKNSEVNVNRWVDERLATLSPENEWQPNTSKGLARFREQRRSGTGRVRRWTLIAAAAVAACLFLMALPVSQVLAHRCLECSVAILESLSGPVQANTTPKNDRKMAPDFTLNDSNGTSIKLSDYKGKVVLLNFWATWCHGCGTEIPWFIEYENKYKDSGLAIIGASMDDDGWKVVKPFVEEKKMNYPVVLCNADLCKQYGVDALPVTVLIDREGKIVASYAGVVDRAACEAKIQSLLKDGTELTAK